MKDKIIYLVGLKWPWFRKKYFKRTGRYHWGIMDFLGADNTGSFDWSNSEEFFNG